MAFRSTSSKMMAGVSRSKNFRLTLEQLRIYKKVGIYIIFIPLLLQNVDDCKP